MNKNKIPKRVKIGVTVLVSLIAIGVLMHLTMNYLVPFVVSMHNKGGVY
jgi:hypothetical protein